MGNRMLFFAIAITVSIMTLRICFLFFLSNFVMFFAIFLCFVDESRRKGLTLGKRKRGSKKQTDGGERGRAGKEGDPLPGAQVSAATRRPWRQSVSGEERKGGRNCNREVRKRLV